MIIYKGVKYISCSKVHKRNPFQANFMFKV